MTNEQTHKLSEAHETQHQTNVCLAHLVLLINCGPARQMRTAPAAAAPAAPAAAELPTYTRPFYRTLKAGISFAVAIYTIVIGLPAVLLAVGLFAAGFERWWLGCTLSNEDASQLVSVVHALHLPRLRSRLPLPPTISLSRALRYVAEAAHPRSMGVWTRRIRRLLGKFLMETPRTSPSKSRSKPTASRSHASRRASCTATCVWRSPSRASTPIAQTDLYPSTYVLPIHQRD